jgi:hypothetical protein
MSAVKKKNKGLYYIYSSFNMNIHILSRDLTKVIFILNYRGPETVVSWPGFEPRASTVGGVL